MTREEAIKILSYRDANGVPCGYAGGITEALDMAINALTAIDTMQKIVDGDVDTIIAVLKGEVKND